MELIDQCVTLFSHMMIHAVSLACLIDVWKSFRDKGIRRESVAYVVFLVISILILNVLAVFC